MSRPPSFGLTSSCRTLFAGVAVAAVASISLTGVAGASTPPGTPGGGGALQARYSPRYDATDTTFTVGPVSAPIPYGSGGVKALIEITNPSPYLTLTLDNDFLVDAFNKAGAVVGTSTASESAIEDVAPGGTDLVVAANFTSGATSQTVDHFGVANASGDVSQYPAEPFTASAVTASTTSSGYQDLSGSVTNANGHAAEPDITIVGVSASGVPLNDGFAFTDGDQVAAGATAAYKTSYADTGGTPAKFLVFSAADPVLYDADQTYFNSLSPLAGPLVAGQRNTVYPTLNSYGTGGNSVTLANETVQLFVRTAGQAPQLAGQGVTGANGQAAISFTAPSTPQQAYLSFGGDATYFGSSTGDTTYVSSAAPASPAPGTPGGIAAPTAAKVTLNAFTKTVKHHKVAETFKPRTRVAFTGTLSSPDGRKVQLQEFISRHWRTIATSGPIHGSGGFTIHVKAPSKKGTQQFRIFVPNDLLHGQGTSKAVSLKVA